VNPGTGTVFVDSSWPSTPGQNGAWTFRVRSSLGSVGVNITAYVICA
jgi:hypothetical protein